MTARSVFPLAAEKLLGVILVVGILVTRPMTPFRAVANFVKELLTSISRTVSFFKI
jgi:hypothetical protein